MGMKKKRNSVSCREYYSYKLQIRSLNDSMILHIGRLLQQFVVDMYVKLETSRLDYFRKNQTEIRAELYQGIMDSVDVGETRGIKVGRRIILPSTFIGGPRDMRRRGATSFDDLKCVNGVQCLSYRDAALLHGLLESDNSFELCLEEASLYQMPYSLRSDRVKRSKVLGHINIILESMGKTLADYDLLEFDIDDNDIHDDNREISEELSIVINDDDIACAQSLNIEQKYAYDQILDKVFSKVPGLFFIDGPGGSGKTFLYKTILAAVRSKGLIALATASSGVAASILPGGRTAHSRFKIPLVMEEHNTCHVSKQSGLAKLMKDASLIVWDEAPMVKKEAIESLDKMLQDINECDLLFGGKVVFFCGDFRQVLPVVPKDKSQQDIHEDFLNMLVPNGFPPHELRLKVNCPVILLRNINPSEGLCNGTRLICRRFNQNVIDAEISVGEYRGKRVFLPRIPFIPIENVKDVYILNVNNFQYDYVLQ
ncbi:hypothetical protein FEM48_ZijujUnG0119500 [Ziziphus jujuba var. spinosa]|uniref:ATP-dependent DNA helicase n=1 Tax=Ziziphus jujuba var. spinosa TaxID=714518 RepID=A0A978U7X9_ZIZJJ|nr:hypothetical protein FEM48_ZijujUnG0119500 [Ziziphus jujuba var. spinosa]